MNNSTCPGCGSSNVYNSGFNIECPTQGCRYFTQAQANSVQGAPLSVGTGGGEVFLKRGETYVLECANGSVAGTSRNVGKHSVREIEFDLSANGPNKQATLVMGLEPDYQFSAVVTSSAERTTLVLNGSQTVNLGLRETFVLTLEK